jgi:hypothetical protein
MPSSFRRRPSPAMLVALLALVVAMTGTATAAVLITSPDQLADRVVTSSKLDNEAVSAEKLATDSVNSRALNEPSVESTNLNDLAVTRSKLATDAVDERALATRSVGNSELQGRAVTNDKLLNPVNSASVNPDGTLRRSVGVNAAGTRRTATGNYIVAFNKPVDDCAMTVTPIGAFPNALGTPFVASVGDDRRVVLVQWRATAGQQLTDVSFSVIVQC